MERVRTKQNRPAADLSIRHYRYRKRRCFIIGGVLLAAIVLTLVAFVGMGAMRLGFLKTWGILWAKLTGNAVRLSAFAANEAAIVWDIRLPRILCGILVGMGLSVAGVIFQSLLRNPLADPYTLGVSTGAAFGASLAILMGLAAGIVLSTTAMAFLFAFLTLVLVIFIARRGGGIASSNLVISGIIVSAILSSGLSFLKMVAGEDVGAIVFWLMGSLSSKQWGDVAIVAPVVLIGSAVAIIFANDLNVMVLGEKSARNLGVNTGRIRMLYLILGSCITAACVAVSGVIGFVGLVIPHILRFWLTPDNRMLLPLSGLLGGLLLSAADNATRLLFTSEIPVGVLTTLIGGPFFIYVFVKRRGGQGVF
ncbi:FecCD family ABC transporter permease [Zongyangia hominis]|uniref:Iron ABC transporter permease n=1 Tax=Zongyangia hominis TaxID=2763677 RepID=A0A926ECM7_9FIRM|nr:iron ABC transporter permease [Zongyangia hominis]MBC8569307.1 iron ABC transporter permease [Zongyangia hominis]